MALLTVAETATFLSVSKSWVYRHLTELPVLRQGHIIRIDTDGIQSSLGPAKSLKPERSTEMMVNRYQRGHVYQKGKNRVWYGRFREDTPEGRRPRNVRLGSPRELPSKTAALKKLLVDYIEPSLNRADVRMGAVAMETEHLLNAQSPSAQKTAVTFNDFVERWKAAEGAALGKTTFEHYKNALNAYVLPKWRDRAADTLNREAIQTFLVNQAEKYSRSSLKSMRLVIVMVLGWAERNGDINRPVGWLQNIRLPRKCGGSKRVRTVLTPENTLGIIASLKEPYDSLVMFVAMLGRRIEEATGIQPGDLDDANVLRIRRVVYNGAVEELEQEQVLPLGEEHAELIARIRRLGAGHRWVFHTRKDTPINPGNALKRYLKPAAAALNIKLCGWHDFRHTLTVTLRKSGVHAKVIAGVLGHKKVDLGISVYDHCDTEDIRTALVIVGKKLLPSCYPAATQHGSSAVRNQPVVDSADETTMDRRMVSAEGIEPSTY